MTWQILEVPCWSAFWLQLLWHAEWPITLSCLGLRDSWDSGLLGELTGRVPSKLEQAGHPIWATFYFPSYCSFYSYRFSNHPHHTDSLGWSPISLLGSPVGQESKELQASSFSYVVHIWCTRNTRTSFALTNYGSHSWSQYSKQLSFTPLPKLLTGLFHLPWDFSDGGWALLYFWKPKGHISSSLSSGIEAPLSRLKGA